MDIRIISSLTEDDEDQLARKVLTAIVSLLTDLPVSYSVRIESEGGTVMQHTNLPPEAPSHDASLRGSSVEPAALPH